MEAKFTLVDLHEATAISWFRLTSFSPKNNLELVKISEIKHFSIIIII